MNKIAVYLNEHLLGEVSSSKAMRRRFSRDGSVLTITPEIIVFPRTTNDIRKVARFAWQLAEKGHAMGITVRGTGGDTTGASIGKGIIIDTSAHLKHVINIAIKERLVHAQAGITFDTLNSTIKWQGLKVLNTPNDPCHTTVGGAIANNTLGSAGSITEAIEKLEVVLANGDLVETGRLSKRDLSKKLGLQTFEGEIYRKLSGLIEDNEQLIKELAADPVRDNAGYRGITQVKEKDGSFDLTPLLVGSQGTLGILSEVVLRTEFHSQDRTVAAIVAKDGQLARDIADRIAELQPAHLEVIDGDLFRRAHEFGATFTILGPTDDLGGVVYVEFNDFSDRIQTNKVKKLRKLMSKLSVGMVTSLDHELEEFLPIVSVTKTIQRISISDDLALPILDGSFVPKDRQEEFSSALAELASKHHIDLPTRTNVLTGTIYVYPILKLDVVSDKQKLFRLLVDYAGLVDKSGGAFVSDDAEGRLKSNAAWSIMAEGEAELYDQIRAIFDPFKTLNPDVKQKNEIRTLVSSLRSSYDITDFVA